MDSLAFARTAVLCAIACFAIGVKEIRKPAILLMYSSAMELYVCAMNLFPKDIAGGRIFSSVLNFVSQILFAVAIGWMAVVAASVAKKLRGR